MLDILGMAPARSLHADAHLILVGAGLANGLLAWSLRQRRPDLRILMLEAESGLPPGRTWSFHASDLESSLETYAPLIHHHWDGYEVHFPSFSRSFNSAYCSIKPSKLQEKVMESLGDNLRFNTRVAKLANDHVTLEGGQILRAPAIVDGRGAQEIKPAGFQKFVGFNVRTKHAHGLTRPILMDARVSQIDGYRFFYVLPWGETELLIEDTRYCDTPRLSLDEFEKEIRRYTHDRGWEIHQVLDIETGVLPIPFFPPPTLRRTLEVPRVGMAGGFFHPVTGYSLPDAVRIAERVSGLGTLTSQSIADELALYAETRANVVRFLCALNRMMFLAGDPDKRFKIFEHFHRLPEKSIQRFYRGTLSPVDGVRLLAGRPPVPIWGAIQSALSPSLAMEHSR